MTELLKNKNFKIIGIALIILIIAAMIGAARYLKVKEEKTKAIAMHIEEGNKSFGVGDYKSAYDSYLKAWDIRQKITTHLEKAAMVNLAQIMMQKGERGKARDLFLKAVEFDPFFYPSYLFIGDIYLYEKDADKAIFYFEKGLSLQAHFIKDDPNAALLYYNLGEAFLLKDNKEQAKKNYEIFLKMAEIDPRLQAIAKRSKDKFK
ncbi:MAG: hypothetical protein L0Y62_06965 [Nitrospirae bacterium]|nr:hypothetical protein [Nitrospirota bacterium]